MCFHLYYTLHRRVSVYLMIGAEDLVLNVYTEGRFHKMCYGISISSVYRRYHNAVAQTVLPHPSPSIDREAVANTSSVHLN